jgi:hypothetical protein
MPYILTGSSVIICPHGGRLQHSPAFSPQTLMIDGHLVYFYDDRYSISGCTLGCQRVEWTGHFPDIIFLGSKYLLTNESQASCYDSGSGFKGYALILFFQTKVDTDQIVNQGSKKG